MNLIFRSGVQTSYALASIRQREFGVTVVPALGDLSVGMNEISPEACPTVAVVEIPGPTGDRPSANASVDDSDSTRMIFKVSREALGVAAEDSVGVRVLTWARVGETWQGDQWPESAYFPIQGENAQ